MRVFIMMTGWQYNVSQRSMDFSGIYDTLTAAHHQIQMSIKTAIENNKQVDTCNTIEIYEVEAGRDGYAMRETWRIEGDSFYRDSVIYNETFDRGNPYPIELPGH